jgi:hypothetical protein
MDNLDILGADGGRLAMAFATGCAACFAFLRTVFTTPLRQRIRQLDDALEADRRRCADMEVRLVQRVQFLEGFVLSMSQGNLRQDMQKVLSEQWLDEHQFHRGTEE